MSRGNTCDSCGARVMWAKNDNTGNPAPLDAEPVENGNVVLLAPVAGDAIYHVLTKADRADRTHDFRQKFTSHFATCVNARSHRR